MSNGCCSGIAHCASVPKILCTVDILVVPAVSALHWGVPITKRCLSLKEHPVRRMKKGECLEMLPSLV